MGNDRSTVRKSTKRKREEALGGTSSPSSRFIRIPKIMLCRVLSYLTPEDFARAACVNQELHTASQDRSTLELLASPIDYLAPTRLHTFHGGRGRCQKQAFIALGPRGRYYANFWTSDNQRREEWRGHVEVFDVIENRVVVDRHCRTPEIISDGDFFNVSFLYGDLGFGFQPHVLLATPKGKCTIHDLSKDGMVRCTLTLSTFHAYGEIAAEFFEMPGRIYAVASTDLGVCKLEGGVNRRKHAKPGGLAIWEINCGRRCRVLDEGSLRVASELISVGVGGTRLVRSLRDMESNCSTIQIWDTISATLVTTVKGDEFWIPRNLDGWILFSTFKPPLGDQLTWLNTDTDAKQRFGPGISLADRQPLHTVCGHFKKDGTRIITADEDSVSIMIQGFCPSNGNDIQIRWGLAGGKPVFGPRDKAKEEVHFNNFCP
ncbi:hypothetical protein AAMO2058_000412800 [Amorphochlora amoebiformis]